MIHSFHQASPYKDMPFDWHEVFTTVDNLLSGSGVVLLVALGDTSVGCLVAAKHRCLFNSNMQASELAFWIEPELRGKVSALRLLDAYEAWATQEDCAFCTLSALAGEYFDKLDTVYRRRGYSFHEGAYLKVL